MAGHQVRKTENSVGNKSVCPDIDYRVEIGILEREIVPERISIMNGLFLDILGQRDLKDCSGYSHLE